MKFSLVIYKQKYFNMILEGLVSPVTEKNDRKLGKKWKMK